MCSKKSSHCIRFITSRDPSSSLRSYLETESANVKGELQVGNG